MRLVVKIRPRLALPLAIACFGAGAEVAAQTTTIASLSSTGQAANDFSLYAEITPDGRYVAFQSPATNLVPGDTNGVPDVFVRDTILGTTVRVSVGDLGQEGDSDGLEPSISADGRRVAFFAYATNLVPGDTNGYPDIFVRDLVAGTTVRASVDSSGFESAGGSRYPSLSADGRYVAFESNAPGLVPGDGNGVRDVFVHDLQTGTTIRASVGNAGQEGDGDSLDAAISPDGRYVAFESAATNLVAGDTNGVWDVFVRDLVAGTTVSVSVDSAGAQGNGDSLDPQISELGRIVSFGSDATNLVPLDTNNREDIFVRDLVAGTTVRASVSSAGVQADWDSYDAAMSPDGRWIAFFSGATNLVPGDTNGVEDIFLHDLQAGTTERSSVGSLGQQGNGWCHYPAVSADGRFVAFDSVSTNTVPGDTNNQRDIFVHDRFTSFHLFCAGDGTLATSCPCANFGTSGQGCENSAATGGARLQVFGVTSPDAVRLEASGELPSALSIFLQGDASIAAGATFGDGLRCVGGNLKRLYVKNASGGDVTAPAIGDPSISVRSAQLGDPIPTAGTRYYQVYYRDPDPLFCPNATFNATNGVRIGW
jgi:Tol biopolymer transport system component